jgi:cytochrome c biogenesis protein CcmG, thiol:disulfide interchange protein DsbE
MRDMMAGAEKPIARKPRSRPPADDGANDAFLGLLAKAAALTVGVAIAATVITGPQKPASLGDAVFTLAPLPGLRGPTGFPLEPISDQSLRGQVTVVNVFATWCGPCRAEHPALLDLAAGRRVRLIGLLSADKAENGSAYLKQNGNPFSAISADTAGLARRLGASAYPTTIVLDRNGVAVATIRGSLDANRIRDVLMPAVAKAREI